jgi:hypothetical protein
MAKQFRASTFVWIAVALLTMSSESRAAGRIVIRTYNSFGVATDEMTRAREVAAVILKDAGRRPEWRDCSSGCGDAIGPGEMLVRIVAAPHGVVVESLGCAVIDLQLGTGVLATVYVDRVNVVASRVGIDAGTLLGRAIAHEIGHLLLGTSRHSTTGLMRRLWSDRELQGGQPADWTFTPDEVARIGRGLDASDHS